MTPKDKDDLKAMQKRLDARKRELNMSQAELEEKQEAQQAEAEAAAAPQQPAAEAAEAELEETLDGDHGRARP